MTLTWQIFSNGKYKSVVHRVLVNSCESRISVASLHTLPINSTIRPSPKLISEENPKRYMDTDFATFLNYISSCEPKSKNFLESRKLYWSIGGKGRIFLMSVDRTSKINYNLMWYYFCKKYFVMIFLKCNVILLFIIIDQKHLYAEAGKLIVDIN